MPQEQQLAIEERFARVFNDKSFKEILSKEDYTKYINASCLNSHYKPINPPIFLNL